MKELVTLLIAAIFTHNIEDKDKEFAQYQEMRLQILCVIDRMTVEQRKLLWEDLVDEYTGEIQEKDNGRN